MKRDRTSSSTLRRFQTVRFQTGFNSTRCASWFDSTRIPGILSAKEVAGHGISIGEIRAKLLPKIEGLTLPPDRTGEADECTGTGKPAAAPNCGIAAVQENLTPGSVIFEKLLQTMKTSYRSIIPTIMLALVVTAHGQTFYVPSGTSGISSSSDSTVGIATSSPGSTSTLPNLGYGNPVVNRLGVLDNWGGQATPITAAFKAMDGSSYQELDILSKNIGGPATLLRGRTSSSSDVFWVTLGGDAYFHGNVGIGTTSPVYKLTVSSDGLNNGEIAKLSDTASNQAFLTIASNSRPWDVSVGGNVNLPGKFYLYDETAASIRFLIDTNGNVGIGTTNPTYPLTVNGTVRAKEVIVDTGWSDYVFDKNYKLPALSETEAAIKSEKHLPGIPSAQEVAAHGISVGEMQAKLLAKIEELTLHQIEQEKRISHLEQENQKLHAKLSP